MENLNKLHDLTLKIKSIIGTIDFKENDVRKAYFENLYSIINEFYHGKIFFKISQEIKNGTIKFDQSIVELHPHVTKIYEIADHELLSAAYQNELNRKLFVDTFTNFETTLSFCFEDIIPDADLEILVKDLNFKIIRIGKKLPDEEKELLLAELKRSTFIPLSRKFRYLSKLTKDCYTSDAKSDLEFIEFCSKLRNCISHSAGYYKGKDFEYEFDRIKFIFKDGEFLEMTGENDYVFLKINERLSNIMYALYNCLKHIDFIKYPDDGF